MKALVEKSIEIYGMGHPEVKTVFHLNTIPVLTEEATEEQKKEVKEKQSENEKISKDMRFTSLTKISGRKLTVGFKYSEDGKEVQDKLQMTIVKSDSEQDIKDFILNSINNQLNN